jgi:hypothetical protein
MEEIRKLEKLLIFVWLIQEMTWLYMWRDAGLLLITLSTIIGIALCWKSRKFKNELFFNLALTTWAIANSTWMLYEFFESLSIMKTCTFALFVTSFILFVIGFKNLDSHSK